MQGLRDESRHSVYGIFLLSRLVAEKPELWKVIKNTMSQLLVPALGVIGDA